MDFKTEVPNIEPLSVGEKNAVVEGTQKGKKATYLTAKQLEDLANGPLAKLPLKHIVDSLNDVVSLFKPEPKAGK